MVTAPQTQDLAAEHELGPGPFGYASFMLLLGSLDVIPTATLPESCFQQFLEKQGSETLSDLFIPLS